MDVYQRRRLVALSAIAAIFIVFVLLIRSCGGDDETTTPTPVAGATGLGGATSQSKASYIDQADPICLDTHNSLAGVDDSAPTASSDLAAIISGEIQQLQSLAQPEDGENDLDDFIAALDEQAQAYEEKALALEREDDATAAEIDATIDAAAADATAAAEEFGFQVCGDTSEVSSDGGGGDTGDETETTTEDTSGGTVTPVAPTTTPVAPTTTPVEPPADTGVEPAPPADTGSDTGSGGVAP